MTSSTNVLDRSCLEAKSGVDAVGVSVAGRDVRETSWRGPVVTLVLPVEPLVLFLTSSYWTNSERPVVIFFCSHISVLISNNNKCGNVPLTHLMHSCEIKTLLFKRRQRNKFPLLLNDLHPSQSSQVGNAAAVWQTETSHLVGEGSLPCWLMGNTSCSRSEPALFSPSACCCPWASVEPRGINRTWTGFKNFYNKLNDELKM